jgi:large repetitive protein
MGSEWLRRAFRSRSVLPVGLAALLATSAFIPLVAGPAAAGAPQPTTTVSPLPTSSSTPTPPATPTPTPTSTPTGTATPTPTSTPTGTPTSAGASTPPAVHHPKAVKVLDDPTPTPAPPTVTADTPDGFSVHPTFTVSDVDGGATLDCTVAGPSGGPPVTVATCDTTSKLDLTGGDDGAYTLSVTQTDAGGTSDAGSATYTLDVGTPTIVADTPVGSGSAPTFSVSNIDPDTTLECNVSDPTDVSVTACGSSTSIDVSAAVDGTYTVTVDAKDASGDTSAPATASYEYESSPPPAPVVTGPAAGTAVSPSFSVTDSENVDLTYNCSVVVPVTVPVTTVPPPACGPTTTLDLSGAADGSYTLMVTATDELSQTSSAGSATYTLDTTTPAPVVTLTTPSSSPSSVVAPVFSISDAESPDGPDTFSCVWSAPDGTTISSGACSSGDAFPTAGNGNGTYSLSVTATDSLGNSAVAAPATYVFEGGAPPAPVVTAASPVGNDLSPSFTVTDADPVPLTFDCSVAGLPAADITSCGPATTLDLSSAADGSYTLVVTATDGLGQTSAPGSATYKLDTSTPVPIVALTPPLVSPSSNLTPIFSISDSESADGPDTFSCLWQPPTGPALDSPCADGASLAAAAGDGDYSLTVTATDQVGNTATAAPVIYSLDTAAPAAPSVTLSTPASSPGTDPDPRFAVTDSDSSPGPGLTYSCTVVGATAVPPAAITCGPTTAVDLSGAGRDGGYTLSVTATDAAGNTSPTGSATYVLDTSAPAVPTVNLESPATSPSNHTNPQFAVADTDSSPVPGLTYTCSVTGPTPVPAAAITCAAPTTSVDLSGIGRDGTYTLSVTATDTAGNTSVSAGTATYTLDTTPPPTPHLVLANPLTSPSNVTNPAFTVSDADTSPGPGLTYTCTVTGPTPVPSSAISCAAPTTTVDLSGSGRDGSYLLSVTATDAAGNSSLSSATIAYALDTTAPLAPVVGLASATRSSSLAPLWTWQFGFDDVATALDTASCTLTGPLGWSSTTVGCGHHFTSFLGAGDGRYTLTVTLTDEAGNTASSVSPVYTLDSRAPAGPTVFLRTPSSGTGLNRHPVWVVSGPAGSTLLCTLLEGGHDGTPVAPQAVCPTPAAFSLAGLPDGLFTLRVVAVDAAKNQSFPAWSSYALVPSAPHVRPPHDENAMAVWSVSGNPSDPLVCTLTHSGRVIAGPRRCNSHPTFHMSGLPRGDYTLSVVAFGAEGVHSAAGTATWFWVGKSHATTVVNQPGPPGGHHPTSAGKQPPKHPPAPGQITHVVRRRIGKVDKVIVAPPVTSTRLPPVQPNRVTQDVVKAVQGVVHTVGVAGGGTGFPLLLLGLVLLFLLAQNRIDRRDPKLALASTAADDKLEFLAPPSRRDRP